MIKSENRKRQIVRRMAKDGWECGHPFSPDDYEEFAGYCKEAGFDCTPELFDYFFECYEYLREDYYEQGNQRHI